MILDVLLVDDSDIIRTMVHKTLQLAKLPLGSVYQASNGKEALEILEDTWVDLVLADINMPVMDGLEMVDRIRANAATANVPVVVISTEGNNARIAELEAKGVAAFIRKPFTPEALRDVISSVTKGWSPVDHGPVLDDVFQTVLERFAYMFSEPADKAETLAPADELLYARMTFSGAVEGAMGLAAPLRLCREMTRNVLGEDGDPTSVEREADTLGEILNIAAGHVTTSLNAEAPTDLAPPIVTVLSAGEWETMLATPHTRAFYVEDHPALLSLGLRPKV